jgi:hypothetical protein
MGGENNTQPSPNAAYWSARDRIADGDVVSVSIQLPSRSPVWRLIALILGLVLTVAVILWVAK